jgi:hypothetical protein
MTCVDANRIRTAAAASATAPQSAIAGLTQAGTRSACALHMSCSG